MPLFFLISGYLLNLEKGFVNFAKDKGKRILIPYYITECIICILLILADVIRGMRDKIIPDFLTTLLGAFYGSCYAVSEHVAGVGAMWFLWALFWAMIIVKYLMKYKFSIIYIILLAIVAQISSKYVCLPFSIQPGCVAAVFVYIGARLKNVDIKSYFKNKMIFIATLLIFMLEICLGIRVDMAKNLYIYGVVSVIGAIGICYFVICLSNIIETHGIKIRNVFKFLGENSLYILCIHQIEMRVFPWSLVLYVLEAIGAASYFNYAVVVIRILGCSVCAFILSKVLKESRQQSTLV